jgi:hypothetical protein
MQFSSRFIAEDHARYCAASVPSPVPPSALKEKP